MDGADGAAVGSDADCGGRAGTLVEAVNGTPHAETLHRCTVCGEHATTPFLLAVARRCQTYIRPGDAIVDLCCGANEWLPRMKYVLDACGIQRLTYHALSGKPLSATENPLGFRQRDWRTARLADVAPAADGTAAAAERLVIGLCPPWGTKGGAAAEFLAHAAAMGPRLLVLTAPESVALPAGYVCLDKSTSMADRCERWRLRTYHQQPLCFFLLQRRDTCRRMRVADPERPGAFVAYWDHDPERLGWQGGYGGYMAEAANAVGDAPSLGDAGGGRG